MTKMEFPSWLARWELRVGTELISGGCWMESHTVHTSHCSFPFATWFPLTISLVCTGLYKVLSQSSIQPLRFRLLTR